MLALLFVGSLVGSLVSWIVVKILWHLRVRINGGPFHTGDLVQVINGTYAGQIAEVYEDWPSRNQVRVGLGESAKSKDVFSHLQLCRVRRRRGQTVETSLDES